MKVTKAYCYIDFKLLQDIFAYFILFHQSKFTVAHNGNKDVTKSWRIKNCKEFSQKTVTFPAFMTRIFKDIKRSSHQKCSKNVHSHNFLIESWNLFDCLTVKNKINVYDLKSVPFVVLGLCRSETLLIRTRFLRTEISSPLGLSKIIQLQVNEM